MSTKTSRSDDDTDPVAAAREAIDGHTPGTPIVDLMTEAAVTTGAMDPSDRPAALVVDGESYVWMPEIDAYASEAGDLLDLRRPSAVKALFAWRQARERQRALEAAKAEQEQRGPDDVHMLHVEHPHAFGEFEHGRRWVWLKDLQPGVHGNEGVRLEHGVVVRWAPEVDEDGKAIPEARRREHVRMQHFRITHVGDKVVSIEPGERLREHAVVFYPKPYVRDWLELAAAVDRTTMDRWITKLVHQAYAVSDLRTAARAGSGMAGKVGANPGIAHDLAAGRRAREADRI